MNERTNFDHTHGREQHGRVQEWPAPLSAAVDWLSLASIAFACLAAAFISAAIVIAILAFIKKFII